MSCGETSLRLGNEPDVRFTRRNVRICCFSDHLHSVIKKHTETFSGDRKTEEIWQISKSANLEKTPTDHAEVPGIGKGYGGRSDQANKYEIIFDLIP